MYLLYPTPASGTNGYAIFEIPAGQTAEELATSFGLTMAQCAEFDMTSFDAGAVNFQYCFTLIDNQPAANGAAFELGEAKVQASVLTKSNSRSLQQTSLNGFSPETLAAQATLAEVARIPAVQETITQVNALAVQLEVELAAIAASTSATELSNIAYPPTGVIFTGRGEGENPLNLNVSYYTEFNSASMTEAETELYVPATSTVIAYGSGGAGRFDSAGNCFTPGNFLVQIRETYTSRVIAEFECPLAPAGEDVAF